MEKFSRYLSADISAGISADSIGRLDYRSYSKLCKDWMEDLKDPLFLFLEGVEKDWHIHLWSG